MDFREVKQALSDAGLSDYQAIYGADYLTRDNRIPTLADLEVYKSALKQRTQALKTQKSRAIPLDLDPTGDQWIL